MEISAQYSEKKRQTYREINNFDLNVLNNYCDLMRANMTT